MTNSARSNLIDFAIAVDPLYDDSWFHEVLSAILQSSVVKVERGEDVRIIVEAPPRHGKLLSDDTPILSVDGWKTHGELKIGDHVFGRNGQPVKILALSDEDYADYAVYFSDGSIIHCHGNHEWVVHNRNTKNKAHSIILETKLLAKSSLVCEGLKGKRGCRYRFQIDENVTLLLPHKNQEIHPYMLGVWLGDGTFSKNCIANSLIDRPIVSKLIRLGYDVTGESIHNITKVRSVYFRRLYSELIKEGYLVKGKGKTLRGNKRIHNNYLFASIEQRLELLAGLIDTDGHKDNKDRYRFTTCSKELASDVKVLVNSLGSRAYITTQKPEISSSGIIGRNNVYQVGFNLAHVLPVALIRKKNTGKYKHRKRSIIAIEKSNAIKKGRCIQVDGGIYLAGENLIPTHNSDMSTIKFPAWVLGHHPEWPIIVGSYSTDIAVGFGSKARDIMNSVQYQKIFSTRLRPDTRAKGNWLTDKNGGYYSSGIGGSMTGRGFKIGIIDDPIKDRKEAESKVIRDNVWDWYRSTFYTREEGASAIIVVNTRWHTDDLVGRLIQHEEESKREGVEHYDKWTRITFPAIALQDEDYRKKGEPLWPAKFSLDKLKKKENELGPYEFAALYQANPITSANQEFKQEWFRKRSWEEVSVLDTRKFATIDPGGKEAENDYTGIVRNYVDRENKWNLRAMGVHFDSMELLNYLFTLHDEGFETIGIEETVYLKAIKPFFDEKCRSFNKFPHVVALKQPSIQKEVRIRGLIPRYSSGSIFHIDGECRELEQQLIVFPKGANDDVPDALAMQIEIAKPPQDRYIQARIREDRNQRRSTVERNYGL